MEKWKYFCDQAKTLMKEFNMEIARALKENEKAQKIQETFKRLAFRPKGLRPVSHVDLVSEKFEKRFWEGTYS